MKTVELRCAEEKCKCSKYGKLLVKIYNLPEQARNRDVIIEVPCPHKKSKMVELKVQ